MENGNENAREQITNMEEVREIQMCMDRLLEQCDKQHQVNEELLIKLEIVQRTDASALIVANREIQFTDLLKTTLTTSGELKSDNKILVVGFAELKQELEMHKTKVELADKEEQERYDLSSMIGSDVPKCAMRLYERSRRAYE